MGRTLSTTHRWHFCRALYLQPSNQKLGRSGFREDGDDGEQYPQYPQHPQFKTIKTITRLGISVVRNHHNCLNGPNRLNCPILSVSLCRVAPLIYPHPHR